MIKLSDLTHHIFYLNPELIYRIDELPDTIVTMTTGERVIVSESAEEVTLRILDYRRKINFPILNKEEDEQSEYRKK